VYYPVSVDLLHVHLTYRESSVCLSYSQFVCLSLSLTLSSFLSLSVSLSVCPSECFNHAVSLSVFLHAYVHVYYILIKCILSVFIISHYNLALFLIHHFYMQIKCVCVCVCVCACLIFVFVCHSYTGNNYTMVALTLLNW
jgi:hypothetical protein